MFKNTCRLSSGIAQRMSHAFWIMAMLGCFLTAPAIAQDVKNVSWTNVSAEKAFQQLSGMYKVRFYYTGTTVTKNALISIPPGDRSLEQVLQYLTEHYHYSFRRNNNMISVGTANAPASVPVDRIVKGRVSLQTGDAIEYAPGVTVRETGTSNAAITDESGYFSLKINNDQSELQFSCVGYDPTNVSVGGRSQVNITLRQNVRSIQEVVVSTGYQKLARKNTTGAYSSITEKEIERRSSQSLNSVLEGTIPGLTLAPGFSGTAKNRTSTGTSLQIRGGSSIQSDRANPLIIVDGFEVNQLPENMNDVAKIDVLKDAAAAAIWGARASNGVIVITTKRGKEGIPRISYSTNTYFTARPDYSTLRRADAATMVGYDKELFDRGYLTSEIFDNTKTGYSPSYDLIFQLQKGLLSPDEYKRKSDSLGGISNQSQVEDLLLRTGFRTNHFLSMSGGGKSYRYMVSGSYDRNQATSVGSNSDLMQLNTRSDFDITKTLHLNVDINSIFSKNSAVPSVSTGVQNLPVYQLLTDNSGNYLYDYTAFNKTQSDRLAGEGYYNFGKNLLQDQRLANNITKNFGLRTNVGLDWKIVKGLTASTLFMYDRQKSSNNNDQAEQSSYVRNLLNQYATEDANKMAVFNLPKGDVLSTQESTISKWASRTQLNYTNLFSGKHFINLLGGIEFRKSVTDGYTTRKLGYNPNLLSWQTIDQKALLKGGMKWWDGKTIGIYDATGYDGFTYVDNRDESYYGTGVYTYDDKYTLSGSFRVDQSNLFGADPKYRSSPLWSAGGAWDISKENFFHVPAISMLKLRATVGLTGSYDPTTTPLLVATQRYQANLNDYALRVGSYNPKLRWERTRTVNIGADLGMFDGRFQVTLDAYNKYGYDLFGTTILDPTVGMTSMKINAARMRNKGIEATIQGYIIDKGTFRWNSRLNFAYNKNIILENRLSDGNPVINRPSGTVPYTEGYSRETLWSYKWAGLDERGNPMVYGDKGEKVKVATSSSLVASGTYRAPYAGGFTNIFTYKDFFASVFATFNFGNVLRRQMPDMNGFNFANSLNYQVANRWRKPGDELKTDIPALSLSADPVDFYDGRDRVALYSSNSVMPGDYIRLREVQLGYNMPNRILKGTPLKGVHFIVQMNNLALWTKNKYGIDPDAIDPITGSYFLPEPKVTTLTLRVDL